MTLLLLLAIVLAAAWWLAGRRASSLNERLYLRRRGYSAPEEPEPRGEAAPDAHLLAVIDSLEDLSPYSRERAAQELARMCQSGRGDSRMFAPLVTALDDNDASVRRAAASALASLGDRSAIERLKRRIDVEDSVAVRSSLKKAVSVLENQQGQQPELGVS
jgi:HEAT repeat protein